MTESAHLETRVDLFFVNSRRRPDG